MFDKYPVAYCMNVHPAQDLNQLIRNIDHHAVQVRHQMEQLGLQRPLGLGLWFPADVAAQLQHVAPMARLKDAIEKHGFVPFTFNGFPYGNFHQDVVKHEVYRPTWAESERLEYTINLIQVMHELLPEGMEGSISTLPLGWPDDSLDEDAFFEKCNHNLHTVASHLDNLRSNTGRSISVCIEPEPGCLLGTAYDVIRFFEEWVFESTGPNWKQDYLKVCHDICHSTVMNESQAGVIEDYNTVGIDIGKVQVSSAPIAVFDSKANPTQDFQEIIEQLKKFDEQRYLHQTTVIDDQSRLFDDLGIALDQVTPTNGMEWRVHFHLPIYLDQLGALQTSQQDILDAAQALKQHSTVEHYEIETYAWNVLPERDQFENLERGIAHEIDWFHRNVVNQDSSSDG